AKEHPVEPCDLTLTEHQQTEHTPADHARGAVRPDPQVAPQRAPATEDFSDLDEEADSIRQFQQR
ncbi:hypothetical protein ACFXKC_56985, partial [Streptomyces sp. NPDC059340]|uniref:hypothetical protein n=1 Tax=Streptomyces sp. NPDC059340 TaxID=3346806 RepID=UPI00367E02DE